MKNAAKLIPPVPCPICAAGPDVVRHMKTYWRVECTSGKHTLRRVSGHPMKTQKDATKAWNDEFGAKSSETQP